MSIGVPAQLERRIAELKPGDHVCSIYESPAEQLAITVAYVKAGLARGQRCIHIVDGQTPDEVGRALAGAGVGVGREQERGALRLLSKLDAYLRNGEFSPAAMLDFLRREEQQAVGDGFSGLWVSGDMTWVQGKEPGTDRLIEYEALLNNLTDLRRSVVLCQYDEALFGRPCIHDVLRTHSDGVLRAAPPPPEAAAQGAGEREELYRFLMENTHDVVSLYDEEGRRVYISPSSRRLLGTVPARLYDGIHPDDLPAVREALGRVLAGERVVLTFRSAHADDSWRWLESSGVPVQFRGRPHVLAVTRDVTERRQAEEQVRRAGEQAHKMLDTIPTQIWSGPADGTLDYCNHQWRAYTGLGQEDVQGHGWQRILHPDDKDRVLKAWHESVAAGTPYEREERHRGADGAYRWFLCRGLPLRGADGRVERWYGANTDIEDHKRAGEELQRTNALLRAVAGNTPDGVFVKDRQGRYLLFNEAACRLVGKPAGEVLGRDDTALFDPDGARRIMDHDRRVMEAGVASTEEEEVTVGGVPLTFLATKAPYRDEHGRIVGLIGISHDITERKRAEVALRRSEALLRRAEAMAHVASWTLDVADGTVLASAEGQRLFGWPPGPHRLEDLMALVHPEDRPRMQAAVHGALAGTPFETEHRIVVGGEVKWVRRRVEPEADPQGRVVRLVGVSQDVTAHRRLEEQFRQAQKMEAVGTLAGGVAHDFNNLLTIINGYSDLLLNGLQPGDPMRDLLTEIHKAGERAGALTRQLLMFSRQQVVEPKVLDLNAVVADAEKMLRRLIGEDVILTAVLDPSVAPVKADQGQLQQVLMNLSVNARDAMPRGGRLTVETRGVTLDENYARTHPQVRPGEYVMLAVSDTGTGMDPRTKARIFEPFFTTKGAGKGTGLGLAVVHGVVTQSEGHIEVYSEVGEGTTFKIYLPAVAERSPTGKSGHGPHPMPRGDETVLLVEDEDAVRALARHILGSCGYTVLEAANGREAVRVAQQHPGPIDLLVSDVVMPHLGGRQLAERLAGVKPAIKVLFLSGYTDDAVVRHGVLEAESAFLQKPFTPTALAQKVREVLDAKY